MKSRDRSKDRKRLEDLEPRKTAASVRGGRLALARSSVKVSKSSNPLAKKVPAYKIELDGLL